MKEESVTPTRSLVGRLEVSFPTPRSPIVGYPRRLYEVLSNRDMAIMSSERASLYFPTVTTAKKSLDPLKSLLGGVLQFAHFSGAASVADVGQFLPMKEPILL